MRLFVPHVRQKNLRQRLSRRTLCQRMKFIMSATGFVPTLHGRRCGAQNAQCVIQARAIQRQVAPVVARGFRLFVGRFVFLVDNDQAESFEGQKHCGTRSQNHVDRSVQRSLPHPHAFAVRKPAVPKSDANTVRR